MIAVFHNTFDWTAIGTLALAVVTGISLAFGWGSLRQTQQEITISRQEVEQAQRPVVVPVADHRRISPALPGVGDGPAMPRVYEEGKLLAPIENIGSGPALRIVASVKLRDEVGNPSVGPDGPKVPAYVAGLGTGVILPLSIGAHGWQSGVNFQLDVEYDDVAGKGWKTTSLFVSGHYEGTSIEECVRTRPLSGMVAPVPPGAA
jgi:hypothetical protein